MLANAKNEHRIPSWRNLRCIIVICLSRIYSCSEIDGGQFNENRRYRMEAFLNVDNKRHVKSPNKKVLMKKVLMKKVLNLKLVLKAHCEALSP